MSKKKEQSDIDTTDGSELVNHDAVKKASDATAELGQQLRSIDDTYLEGEPYEFQLSIQKSKYLLYHLNGTSILLGREILLIKEHEPHGRFMEAVKEIGLDPRVARRLMQVAVKYTGNKKLIVDKLNKTKVIELLTIDDEGLEELSKGGTVAGLTLDEIDSMATSELRAALRKERKKQKQTEETNERILADKNKKIDELDGKLQRRNNFSTIPEILHEIRMDTLLVNGTAMTQMDKFDQLRNQILKVELGEYNENDAAITMMAMTYLQCLLQVQSRLVDLFRDAEQVFMGYVGDQFLNEGRIPDFSAELIEKMHNNCCDMADEVFSRSEKYGGVPVEDQ